MTYNVLVIDDTLTSRQLLVHIINHSGDMVVVGEGSNGEQALQRVREGAVDVVLMDIVMPRMDGLEATRRIMETNPVPIVLITASLDVQETDIAFRAMQAGALAVLQKPAALNPGDVAHVRNTVRAMSQVKVIHHYGRTVTAKPARAAQAVQPDAEPDVVAIASSTGGPAALAKILHALPPDFPLPILIVQHISPDFVESLVTWLQHVTSLKIHMAEAGVMPQKGHVYIAPGDAHLHLQPDGRLGLLDELGTWRYMPSCDVLFHSVAQVYPRTGIGIVLTGMGDDGADGLRAMYEAGAITIAQDEATSVVYGMPQAAVQRGGTQHSLALGDMAPALMKIVSKGATT